MNLLSFVMKLVGIHQKVQNSNLKVPTFSAWKYDFGNPISKLIIKKTKNYFIFFRPEFY